MNFIPVLPRVCLLSESSRIAGPVLVVVSLVLHLASVTYCLAKRRRARMQEAGGGETESLETGRGLDLDTGGQETRCLLDRAQDIRDIACFPDGSLR